MSTAHPIVPFTSSQNEQEEPKITSLNPVCSICKATDSMIWSRNKNEIVCKSCMKDLFQSSLSKLESKDDDDEVVRGMFDLERSDGDELREKENNRSANKDKSNDDGNTGLNSQSATDRLRKSSRSRSKMKASKDAALKNLFTKGKGRRSIFKKCVYKSPSAVITPVTSESIYFNGQYFQAGDIVSLTDIDGGTFYAQIRGFLQDQYCEKSAAITWLIPTQSSPVDSFDPSTYILGPEEDIPRKLESMQFVCNCPSDYFRSKHHPYPLPEPVTNETGFIWTRIGPTLFNNSKGLPKIDE